MKTLFTFILLYYYYPHYTLYTSTIFCPGSCNWNCQYGRPLLSVILATRYVQPASVMFL